jgi:L-lactate dehydrogenase complex protein LldE
MIRVFWRELFELAGDATEVGDVERLGDRTFELAEFLERTGIPPVHVPDDTPTVYHRSCHMLRELRIDSQPEEVLARTGTSFAGPANERCCGFGGTFAVKLPEVSTAMADDVLDAVVATGAQRLVGCDATCLLHLRGRAQRRGLDLELRHLATIVDHATVPPDPGGPGR